MAKHIMDWLSHPAQERVYELDEDEMIIQALDFDELLSEIEYWLDRVTNYAHHEVDTARRVKSLALITKRIEKGSQRGE